MSTREKVIALGFFDGVHLGHAALLRRTVEEAARRGVVPAVFTFDRPPKEVVTGQPCPLINSPLDRADLMRRLYGIQEVIMVPFDQEMMTTSWEDYITEILVKRYHAVHLVAGHDHHFGHKNQGSPELLAEKCRELGLGCDIIPKVEIGGITVSSSYIRRLVELGQVERARLYLGHPHVLTDRRREQFPVLSAWGCRSEIENAKTLFLADKPQWRQVGLTYARLRFTTEDAAQCAAVLRRYAGAGDFTPGDLTRGLYYRGVD